METKEIASKNLAQAYFSHDWNTDLSFSYSPDSINDPNLFSDSTLETQQPSLHTSHESQILDPETTNQLLQSTIKILKEAIEKYKVHIERLTKANESKMKKLLVFQHFINEYCKNCEISSVEIDLEKELKQVNELRKERETLGFEERFKEISDKHDSEIRKYQQKIQEIVGLLKKEKVKTHKLSETTKKAIEYMKNKQGLENATEPKGLTEVIIHQNQINKSRKPPKPPKSTKNWSSTLSTLQDLKSDFQSFKEYISKICEKFPLVLSKLIKNSLERYSKTSQNQKNLQKLSELLLEKKLLIEQLHQLKGNIRVFCRVRPLLSSESKPCIETFDKKLLLRHPFMKTSKFWDFDHIFPEHSTQNSVFSEVKDLIISSFDGYNICIFTYGQTGSGKTYTLEGPQNNPGLIPNICSELFKQKSQRLTWDYKISFSLLEVYNETLKDLLNPEKCSLKIMNGKVKSLTKVKIFNLEQLQEIVDIGCKNRVIGSNGVNEHSSRSHLVLNLGIKGKSGSAKMKGKIQVVDLAGSERLKKTGIAGETLNEAKFINLSLHTLGNVITAKQQKSEFVPFRNSVLTQVLQDCLNGEAKVLMIVQISPEVENYEESVSSLNFASVAKGTCLGAPKSNIV